MKERRGFVRLDSSFKIRYKLLGKREQVETLSKNISGGGICITLAEELPLGNLLELEIILPEVKQPIFSLGKLVWIKKVSSGYESGIAMDIFDREIILQYVARQIRKRVV